MNIHPFYHIKGLLNISFPWQIQAQEETAIIAGGNVQKSPSSKAAVLLAASHRAHPLLTRGAYMEYVSTAKWRERRLACPILKGGPFVFNIPINDNLQERQEG